MVCRKKFSLVAALETRVKAAKFSSIFSKCFGKWNYLYNYYLEKDVLIGEFVDPVVEPITLSLRVSVPDLTKTISPPKRDWANF